MSPRVQRYFFFQVGAIPLRDGARFVDERCEAFFRGRIAAYIEPECIERLLESGDLGFRHRALGFAELGKVLGTDIGGKHANDHNDDQQFEQGKSTEATMELCMRSWHGLAHVSTDCGWPAYVQARQHVQH
ncbi:conserved hypothetical protein, partial [Ricinus communis]